MGERIGKIDPKRILRISIALLFFLLPLNVLSQRFWGEKRPILSGIFSLTVPGTGQLYNKRPLKALMFFSATMTGLYFTINNYHRVESIYNDHIIATDLGDTIRADKLYNDYRNAFLLHQNNLFFLGIIWLLNAMDAFFDAHFIRIDLKKEKQNMLLYIEGRF